MNNEDIVVTGSKLSIAVVSSFLTAWWDVYGVILICVAFVMILDVLTGLIKCGAKGIPLSSKTGTIGFWKKMASLSALVFGIFLDYYMPLMLNIVTIELPFSLPIGGIIACYIIINESISICENIYAVNNKALPGWLKKALQGGSEKLNNKSRK